MLSVLHRHLLLPEGSNVEWNTSTGQSHLLRLFAAAQPKDDDDADSLASSIPSYHRFLFTTTLTHRLGAQQSRGSIVEVK